MKKEEIENASNEYQEITSSPESLARLNDTIIKQLQRAHAAELKIRDARESKLVAALEKIDECKVGFAPNHIVYIGDKLRWIARKSLAEHRKEVGE